MTKTKHSILWFRKGLRLHDNPALLGACDSAKHLYPVFILDPWFLKPERVGPNRLQFLLESLEDLKHSLQARGSDLIVLKGKPSEVFPTIWKAWSITHLYFEKDTEPYANERDSQIREAASVAKIEVDTPVSHTLYDLEMLIDKNGGVPPDSYGAFGKLLSKVGLPAAPAEDPPEKLAAPGPELKQTKDVYASIPTLKDLGYREEATTCFHGGETNALSRMSDWMADKQRVADFEKPKGNPAAFDPPATTVLSPYMKFGCLSARLFHAKIVQIEKEKKGHTQPPTSLKGQLLWREFFYTVGGATKNFDKMEGNPICRQIDWDANEEFFRAWEEARTGYPWIDAIMVQLQREGWMHHLARHAVACFLTRGDLYVSWEKGRDVFDRLLIDADWHVNNGNWMWLSASAFFHQFFRVYSPVSFGKKYDKNGDFIRHYIPALKDFPAAHIYEPWKASEKAQKEANCIIGKDYPKPIVEHSAASQSCKDRMKAAYDADKESKKRSGAASPESRKAPKIYG